MITIKKKKAGFSILVLGTPYFSRKQDKVDAILNAAEFADKCGCVTDARLLFEYARSLVH